MDVMRGEPRLDVRIYLAAWTALLAIYFVALFANGVAAGMSLRNAVANLLPDALLGLLVFRTPSFVKWSDDRRGHFFAAHVACVIAFVVLASAGWIALVALDSWIFNAKFALANLRILPFRVLNGVLIYGTIAGIAYARRNAEEVRQQAERAAKAEALRARASLEAMRSQLNPHFIFNTFHALVGLVRRDPAIAESALERLGDLLRYSLRVHRDGIDEVPLREECAFVQSYLGLEQLRLADRLRVQVHTPEPTLDYLVPTFAVQILAENAIRHAIAPRAAGGSLEIQATAVDGHLHVAVKDECSDGLQPGAAPLEGSGMGLRLLHDRLAALYGDDAKLTLREIDGGTCADLTIPLRRVPEDAP